MSVFWSDEYDVEELAGFGIVDMVSDDDQMWELADAAYELELAMYGEDDL